MPSPSAASISARSASRVIMVPVGLAGLADQHALERRAAMRVEQHVRRDRPARRRRGLDQHRLAAERLEDVPVRRIAGHRDRDAVARLEQRKEGEDEAGRRAGGRRSRATARRRRRRLRRSGARSARAATGCRALRYRRAGRTSAARAASSAVGGAGAAGWPTSMWMTRPPAASMRAAAAITSITMNGGTSLRAEGTISRFAASSIDFNRPSASANLPRCCRIRRLRLPTRRGDGDCAVSTCRAGRNGAGSTARMRAASRRDIDTRWRLYAAGSGPARPSQARNFRLSMTLAERTITAAPRRPSRAMAIAVSLAIAAGHWIVARRRRRRSRAGGRAADHPRRRDRAAAARIYPADPEGGRPGAAEHPGRDHQPAARSTPSSPTAAASSSMPAR